MRRARSDVATRSAMLLKEAREMRSVQNRKNKSGPPPIDPKPFSLEEMAARALVQKESQTLLSLAQQFGQDRLHIVFFGFDAAAVAADEVDPHRAPARRQCRAPAAEGDVVGPFDRLDDVDHRALHQPVWMFFGLTGIE